jgi:hypothetical protein
MQVQAAVHLHSNPSLLCAYCGRREEMPQEAAERHRFVRLRLQQLERARLTVEAPLQTFRSIKMAVLPGMGFAIVMMGVQLGTAFSHQAVGTRLSLAQLFPVAVMVGMLSGYAGMMLTFRKLVQPLLEARPPSAAGMPATCRSCGGDLPAIKAAQVKCGYCRADNVLGAGAAERVGSILETEFGAKMAHARTGFADAKAFERPSRAFYVWGAIGAGVALVGVQLVLLLLG